MQKPDNNAWKLHNTDVAVNPAGVFRSVNIYNRSAQHLEFRQCLNSFSQACVWSQLDVYTGKKNTKRYKNNADYKDNDKVPKA